jgi:hypothetical protein
MLVYPNYAKKYASTIEKSLDTTIKKNGPALACTG